MLELARTSRGSKRQALFDDVIQFVLGQTIFEQPPLFVKTHLIDPYTAVIQQVTAQLYPSPLIPWCGWQVVHQ